MVRIRVLPIFISLLLFGSGFISPAMAEDTVTESLDTDFGYEYAKTLESEDHMDFDPPNLEEYAYNNLTDTSVINATTYDWDDEMTVLNDTYFNITVDIYRVDIYFDSELGDEDIFFKSNVNNYKQRLPADGEYQINGGENATVDERAFQSLGSLVYINIEVMDQDLAAHDSLGFIEFIDYSPENLTGYLDTDNGKARVYLNITAIELNRSLTAGEFIDGMKPFLHIDDEVGNDLPVYTFGRVSEGDDNGTQALVLQYMYYWDREEHVLGGNLHYNDSEMVLIYLNISNYLEPYRIVFNNYYYGDDNENPYEDLLILENLQEEVERNYTTTISESLQILLGVETNQTVTHKPISMVSDWEYKAGSYTNAWVGSMVGYKTVEMTVETRYHTFDLGSGGDEIGYHYQIQDFNHSIIQKFYAQMQLSLDKGTSFLFPNTPEYAPFTFDVRQVFNAPYLISSYGQIVENVKMYEKAQNAGLNLTHSINMGFNVEFPGTLKYTYPNNIYPGTSNMITLEFEKSDEVIFTFFYDYDIHINFSYSFLQLDTNFNNSGETVINLDTNTIQAIVSDLGLDRYELSDKFDIGEYLSFDSLVVTPKLVGELITGEISIDIWQILADLLGPISPLTEIIFYILDFFVDHMEITASINLSSFIETSVSSNTEGIELSDEKIIFTGDNMQETFDLVVQDDIKNIDTIEINISDLEYNMNLTMDWAFDVGFKDPISDLIPDFHWDIGTYPSYTGNIAKAEGGTIQLDIEYPPEPTTSNTEANNGTNASDAPLALYPSLVALSLAPLVQQILMRREKDTKH